MAKKTVGSGGLFAYGQAQMKKSGSKKLFPAIEDINPQLKGNCGKRRR